MKTDAELPRHPRDLFEFSCLQRVVYDGGVALARRAGLWNRPFRARGDLADMRFIDKLYWLYKARYPIERARRGSGLESLFREQRPPRDALPAGFERETEITLSAVGDLITHRFLRRSSDTLYRQVSDLIFDADIAMANLECPVIPDRSASFSFRTNAGPLLYFDATEFATVTSHGPRQYALVSTANNHSLDFGAAGVDSTLHALRSAGIASHGMNARGCDARRVALIDRSTIRVAVLAFTFGLNAHRPPPERREIVNCLRLNDEVEAIDFQPVAEQLEDARSRQADFVVAQLHWGLEHEFYPTPEQVGVARHLAELGVDAIVGHHPHVIQPAEYYRTRRDPERIVPIFYSLGNLLTPFSSPWLCRSLVARMGLARGRCRAGTRRTYVSHVEAEPVEQVADTARQKLRLMRAVPGSEFPRGGARARSLNSRPTRRSAETASAATGAR